MVSNLKEFRSILKKFDEADLFDVFIVIGSWAVYLYQFILPNGGKLSSVRTLDLDLLVRDNHNSEKQTDVSVLMTDLGFNLIFDYYTGLYKFSNPNLEIEFLINQKGAVRLEQRL
jgi:hypothetical protein